MSARLSNLVGNIRLLIDDVSGTKHQITEIYANIDLIQNQILLEKKVLESIYTITMVASQEAYSLIPANGFLIKDMLTSWNYPIKYVPNSEWDSYRNAVIANSSDYPNILFLPNYPIYATIFGAMLYLSPIPTVSGDTITIWAYQLQVANPTSNLQDPVVPSFCDMCLIYGVASIYNPDKFYALFQNQLRLVGNNSQAKILGSKEPGCYY